MYKNEIFTKDNQQMTAKKKKKKMEKMEWKMK